MPIELEYVLCPAIWYDDKKEYAYQPKNLHTGIVLCGYAYTHIVAQVPMILHDISAIPQVRGWITSHNRFVTDITDIYRITDRFIRVDTCGEYLFCAATWFSDQKTYACQPQNITHGVVFCGWRHACIFQQIGGLVSERIALGIHEQESGFLTNMNRFVDRKEAARIAYTTNHICSSKRILYSEDLYMSYNIG